MRRTFAEELYMWMEKDPDIWLITVDLGYKMWDKIRDDFPGRFINTGAAEQAAMGIAVGLALEGKKPFIYSITPFLLYRAFETIRNYVNHEKIPVRLIGGGRDNDYKHDGFSHYAGDDKLLFRNDFGYGWVNGILGNIEPIWPENTDQVKVAGTAMVMGTTPYYLNLRR